MRGFAGSVTAVSGATLLGFASIKNETPKGDSLPILIAVFLIAGSYTLLTSKAMVAWFPFLSRLPGAASDGTDTLAIVNGGGDQNINLGYQEVGINKGTILREKPVVARVFGVSDNVPDGETYVSTYRIVLEGRPSALRACANHDDAVEVDLEEDPDWSAGFATAFGETPEGFPIIETPNPAPGAYLFKVRFRKSVPGFVPVVVLPEATS